MQFAKVKLIRVLRHNMSKKVVVGKATLLNNNYNKNKNWVRTLAKNQEFKDWSLIISTSSGLVTLYFALFINNTQATFNQVQMLSNEVAELKTQLLELLNSSVKATDTIKILTQKIEALEELLIPEEVENLHEEVEDLNEEVEPVFNNTMSKTVGLISLTVLAVAFVLFRPTKALELIESITEEDD